ncbi:MAG TPA: ATP synthase F1 subunit epsilon [Acidobacteriaceae bacterium]|jgi:F-type H+-transporting ATPase subunit epsilon
MAETLKVRLVTPERILVDQAVEAVEVPAKTGYLEVLRGHAPLLAEIGAGEVRLHGGEAGDQRYSVARGFVEVLPDRVTILAEYAQKPEEIDAGAAETQMQQGQKLWSEAGEDADKYAHANEVMAEAEAKLESAGAGKH